MALYYATIPGKQTSFSFYPTTIAYIWVLLATSTVVRTFSQDHLILSHVQNQLSVQSTQAVFDGEEGLSTT